MSSETFPGREDVLNDDELYRLRWHNVCGGQLERCWVDIHGQVRQRQRRRQYCKRQKRLCKSKMQSLVPLALDT